MNPAAQNSAHTIPAIHLSGLTKQYRANRALDGVDLDIGQGEFFGLLGPNGAGKTTLINILAGLVLPTSGTARVMGYEVSRDYRQARRALGVVPQELVFDPFFTAREILRLQSGYFGLRRNEDWIEHVLEQLGLTPHADKNMRALSGGMKRRVLVAQALVHKPPVIVLDEPTAGVDVDLRQTLWKFVQSLNREGHTVVLTTHYLEEAETLCSRIAMLKQGRLVALDSTRNLLARAHGQLARVQLAELANEEVLTRLRLIRAPDGLFEFSFQDYSELENLLSELRQSGQTIQELRLAERDLETVFTEIIRGA